MRRKRSTQDCPSYIKEHGIDDVTETVDFQKIIRGMYRHILLVLLFGLVGALFGGYFANKFSSTYEAQSVLIYNNTAPAAASADDLDILHFTLSSAVEMIKLPSNLRAVKGILGLDESVNDLDSMVTVDIPILDSNLINIVVEAEDENLAVDIANTLASVSVKNSKNLARRQWQEAYRYFKDRSLNLRGELDQQVAQIGDFRKANHHISFDSTGMVANDTLSTAEQHLQQAKLNYSSLLVEYENLKREYSKIPSTINRPVGPDPSLLNRIAQIETILLDARTRYSPTNPKIIALQSQLDELQRQQNNPAPVDGDVELFSESNPVRAQLDLSLISMQARLRASLKLKEDLEEIVGTLSTERANLNEQQVALLEMLNSKNQLELKVVANEETLRRVEVKLNLGRGDLELYQQAESAFPYDRTYMVYALPILGLLFGAFMGAIFALAIEITDGRVRTEKQVSFYYNIPCLSVIPQIPFLTSSNAERKTKFYIRSLIDRMNQEAMPYQTIAIASSTHREGKSFLSYFMGLHYARAGLNVAVVQFDPIKSGFGPALNDDSKSLEDYLRGKASIEEIIQRGSPDIIAVDDPATLLDCSESVEVEQLMEELRIRYDKVILDIPGLVEEEVGISLAKLAETTLFVIGSSVVKKNFVDTCLKELSLFGVKVSGIVLNRVAAPYIDNARIRVQGKKGHRRQPDYDTISENG